MSKHHIVLLEHGPYDIVNFNEIADKINELAEAVNAILAVLPEKDSDES